MIQDLIDAFTFPTTGKALDRGVTHTAVMARARKRRFALNQNINVTVAEAESSQK